MLDFAAPTNQEAPMRRLLVLVLAVSVLPASRLLARPADKGATLRLPLKAEKLSAPQGAALPTYDTIELAPVEGTVYAVRLAPGDAAPSIPRLDLGLFLPRVPGLAKGNETLTRLALMQREFNRNEVHNVLGDGTDFSVANNCLELGLWEAKLARPDASGKTVTLFHAWFTFPKEDYARLFAAVNGGLDEAKYDPVFAKYPGIGGFALSLDELRRVESERPLTPVATHVSDPLDRLPEQTGKTRLIRTSGVTTYADFVKASSQPVTLAKFAVPGVYHDTESMTFDLTWLGRTPSVTWRQVKPAKGGAEFPELELRFENGLRLIAADSKIATLPARTERPSAEGDVLKLVCGIGTPVIHASASDRAAEMTEDRPRYLMLLDAKGQHVDNHFTGVDGLYLWREAGKAGAKDTLHLWLVSYERIALVAHYSVPFPG
jgi:hypothetical protein